MLSKLIEDALNENVIDDSINENEDTNLSSLWYSFHSYEYGYFPCHPSNSDLKSKFIFYLMYPNIFLQNLYKSLILVRWKL